MTYHLPKGPPAVGKGVLSLIRYARAIGKDVLAFQLGRFEKYGDTYTSQVGDQTTLVTREPQHIQQVLVSDGDAYQKPENGLGQAQLRRFLGNGLLVSNGEFWRAQRRQLQPAFNTDHLRTYANTFVAQAREQSDAWRPGACLDISEQMMGLTLRIVGKVLLGQEVRSSADDVALAMTAFRDSFNGLSAVLPTWVPYPPRLREAKARAQMHTMIDSFIAEQLDGTATNPDCLLGVLARRLSEPDAMTRAQLRDEALTLFLAGHETTSHALAWTLYLLSQNPNHRRNLEVEVRQILGDRPATFDDFAALTYTQQVLNEALRLYPPAHSIAREARRDTRLGQYDVPAGAHVALSIYHVQRDPRWHPAATQFVPERFEAEAARQMVPGSYIPFGAGTRACVGKRFALLEATLILATLAQRWRLELAQSHPPTGLATITLAPRGGIQMRVTEVAFD